VIQAWPGGTSSKVPSTIRYSNDGSTKWGFRASTDDPATLRWFKLLLVDEKDMTPEIKACSYIQEAKAALKNADKQPQEVVRDYLSLVWTYTIESMHRHLGKELVDGLPFRVVLTAPATWSTIPNVLAKLERAAEQAGIADERPCGNTKLDIVQEPEAAAFATLVDVRKDRQLQVSYFWFNQIFWNNGGTNTFARPVTYLWCVMLVVALW
jgi:hypothetical protein